MSTESWQAFAAKVCTFWFSFNHPHALWVLTAGQYWAVRAGTSQRTFQRQTAEMFMSSGVAARAQIRKTDP